MGIGYSGITALLGVSLYLSSNGLDNTPDSRNGSLRIGKDLYFQNHRKNISQRWGTKSVKDQRGLLCSEKETFAEVPELLKRFFGVGEESGWLHLYCLWHWWESRGELIYRLSLKLPKATKLVGVISKFENIRFLSISVSELLWWCFALRPLLAVVIELINFCKIYVG